MAEPSVPTVAADGEPSSEEALVAVRCLLGAAGIDPGPRELHALARAYPGIRRQVEALYRVPTDDDVPVTMLHAELDA
jgi:hypothetical protein